MHWRNTLQIRLKQDPQSIKGCLVPALRIRLYIGKYAKFNVDPTICSMITVKLSNIINQIAYCKFGADGLVSSI